MFGGILLALGLLTRVTAIPLIINFIVAYLTTEQDALHKLRHFNPHAFISARPVRLPAGVSDCVRVWPWRVLRRWPFEEHLFQSAERQNYPIASGTDGLNPFPQEFHAQSQHNINPTAKGKK
jgi:hypothetical protein